MPLNFSIVDRFVAEYSETMHDRTLLRHDRYNILVELRKTLWAALRDSERFETELSHMLDAIDTSRDYGKLRQYHEKSSAGIKDYFEEEQALVDVHDLFRIIRDRITVRVLQLVEEEMKQQGFGPPPSAYCWIGLGSEGRDEQTFFTDQDNMLVYGEDGEKRYFEDFAGRMVEGLHEVGFEKCKGGIMPSNEKWRGSVTEWKKRIGETLGQAKGTLELLDLIIITDARVIHGDQSLFRAVLDEFFTLLKENRNIMKEIAESSVMMSTALGFFGKFRVETSGDHQGKFNLKLLGWSPLIMSVRALALEEGLYETNTIKRIKRLRDMNMIKKEMAEDLIDAYLLFDRHRIMNQIEVANKRDSANFVDPAKLSGEESGKLRKAMRTVESFQKYLHEVMLFGQPF
jgi:CBS domain-containing protein